MVLLFQHSQSFILEIGKYAIILDMNILDALVLGVVEGVTEFLPVSSTGHMILVGNLLGIADSTFTKSFEVIIQLGAILAIVLLYRKTILKDFTSMLKVMAAFVPTAIIGYALYKLIKQYLLGNELVVVLALVIGGVLIVLFERMYTKTPEESFNDGEVFASVTYKKAIYIGLFQSLAVIPGVSRSAATIIGGEILRLPKKTIVEFSFLLAVPTMLAATVLDIYKDPSVLSGENLSVLSVGFMTAFIVALFVVKYFLKFIQKHTFEVFGYYRIVIGILYALFIL